MMRTQGVLRFLPLVGLLIPISLVGADSAQKSFTSPAEAVLALVTAAKDGNVQELQAIFGPDFAKVISSGDPVADRQSRDLFLAAYEEQSWLEAKSAGKRILYVGNEDWPFPIPLVRQAGRWKFDTAAGADEMLHRRVGRNELGTIKACLAIVDAQKEFLAAAHDGKFAGLYAPKFVSDPGKHNGLYWKTVEGEPLSPLGQLAAEAAAEGYTRREASPTPFRGYFFRILAAQGAAARGGARSYLADGEMKGGFAVVAYPAEYGSSGVSTFMVNHDGIVYEKDFGKDTGKLAVEMTAFNPDNTWRRATY